MVLHMQRFSPIPRQPVDVPLPAIQPSISTKRPMDQTSDKSELSSPAPKRARRTETPHPTAPASSLSNHDPHNSSHAAFVPPAFAPRTDYVKLIFRNNWAVDSKLRWLSEVTRAFRLNRELAEVKMTSSKVPR